ncbi:MAG: hypothetical protein SFT68_00375 [Rickettsiaceae bacterium]|nr:hypothetical protein [Rickettsiaceae bacterium]
MIKKFFTPFFALFVASFTVFVLVLDELDYVEIEPLYPVPEEIINILRPTEELYMVNFFASWCESCVKEIKYLGLIKAHMDLPIYGITVNDSELNLNKMLGHNIHLFQKIEFSFPMQKLIALNIDRIPRLMIIYKNNVIYDHKGEVNDRISHKKIIPILTQVQNLQHQDKNDSQ